MIKEKEWSTTEEAAERLGVSPAYVREILNRAQYDKNIRLKGVKVGKEWRVLNKSINDYLGIEVSEEDYKKDLYIKELEGKVRAYEIKLNAFEALAITLQNLLGVK
ncbi:MAG: helix-turn-helix domain-containing protein [Clostridiales bacterium]|uniref:helix-turn-helix domain-containing protein n=1 Tax=Caproiciproducens sp. MSJ-32 TaxID=2841527 RepID=UPI0016AB6BD3|nr:helix-turn-helix domain-containing protein [Caproiciproducens sp. MSJ-32]MBU5454537.1 helix-turn-helix domain-containing protein [Caproiciproducens sp. MSJ-32]NLK22614.1 helix-turn-helix domain-containing protein [Clostridiales bacterium]